MGNKKVSSSYQKAPAKINVEAAYAKAVEHFHAGEYSQADQLASAILQIAPRHLDAINLLGVIAQKINRYDLAVEQFLRAINIDGNIALLYFNLGISLCHLGNNKEGIINLEKAISLNPNYFEAYSSLGNALTIEGELSKAVTTLQKAIAINGEFFAAHSNLGNALKAQGRLLEAKQCYKKAIELAPDYDEAYNNLGAVLEELGEFAKAVASYQKAIAINPNYARAYSNLGNALKEQGKLDEAIVNFNKAISIEPQYAQAYFNLANTQKEQNKLQEAVANYQKALSIKPDFADAHSNMIFCIELFSDGTTDLAQREREKWAKHFAAPLKGLWPTYNNNPDPSRRLKIGYVGADFNQHSAAFIFSPMLLHYDRDGFLVYCYAGNKIEDHVTRQLRKNSTGWRSTIGVDDAALATQIQKDGIDILVDLAGHTKGNRLLTFARKPAPIQITAWGSSQGTCMEAMDYLFSDPIVIPQSKRNRYTEEVVDLPCEIHLGSDSNYPQVDEPPVGERGYITFGAFNRLEKYNEQLFGAWAEILRRVPTAKLLIKAEKFDSISVVNEVRGHFIKHGLDNNRVILKGKTSHYDHLKAHNEVDIMLDPYPHNGGMTTLESLRMGVPVLSCEQKSVSPMSSSILHVLGLDEWRAYDEMDYVAKAVEFANDIQTLKTVRGELRERFDKSVLGNSSLYVAKVEAIYRQLWKKWCTANKREQSC
ncbi:MAG: tetratricopeptide repeat protein [Magnetococcales bacterium]|nr:tetratricopeptide repeat protein [Magnetococcales bacterium]